MNILIYNQISIISKLSSISQSAIADSSLYQREPDLCIFIINFGYKTAISKVNIILLPLRKGKCHALRDKRVVLQNGYI